MKIRDSPGGRKAACTGPTPTGVTAILVSPETSMLETAPALAGAFLLTTKARWKRAGSPEGLNIGLTTGRKVSPQPTAKTMQAMVNAAITLLTDDRTSGKISMRYELQDREALF